MNLDRIIKAAGDALLLLEARGLKRRKHRRHVVPGAAKVAAVLRRYWARQLPAVLREVKPEIERSLRHMPAPILEASRPGKIFASTLAPSSLQPLRFPVTKAESDDYEEAMRDVIGGAVKTLARDLQTNRTINEDRAESYLRDNSLSKLTGNIAPETVSRLQTAIGDAWDKGGSYDQIVASIRGTFADFSEVRAGMIAQTEVNDAYNWGRSQLARDMGFDEKAWETESGNPCEECLANEAEGYIDMEDDFQSGDDEPTAHPNCACSLNFRKGSAEE